MIIIPFIGLVLVHPFIYYLFRSFLYELSIYGPLEAFHLLLFVGVSIYAMIKKPSVKTLLQLFGIFFGTTILLSFRLGFVLSSIVSFIAMIGLRYIVTEKNQSFMGLVTSVLVGYFIVFLVMPLGWWFGLTGFILIIFLFDLGTKGKGNALSQSQDLFWNHYKEADNLLKKYGSL